MAFHRTLGFLPRLLREAAWAPLAVLLSSFAVASLPFAERIYPVLHLLGGASLAYFFRRAARLAHGAWPPMMSSLIAFSLACTGALGWEIAEFAVDFVFGTTLQEGLLDTMTDLILAAAGAAAWLALRRCSVQKATLNRPRGPLHRARDQTTVPGRPTMAAARQGGPPAEKYDTAPRQASG